MRNIRLECFPTSLPARPVDSNKGDFGSVAIIGGARGMQGAALLAARAALLSGAGRVYAGLLDDRSSFDPATPELMIVHPAALPKLAEPACRVVGPGLGQSATALAALLATLASDQTLLLDADALNLIATDAHLGDLVQARTAATVLTPHPGEAARLLGCSTGEVQTDRAGCVARLGKRFHAITVLKGAGTLIQAPGGTLWQNHNGNAGMAAPGMGDVLPGIIAALIAQGMDPETAAVTGVWLHGAAGDRAVADGLGPRGLTASELLPRVRLLLNQIQPNPL